MKKGETGQALNTLFNYAYPANGAIQETINHIVQYETDQMNVTQKSVTSLYRTKYYSLDRNRHCRHGHVYYSRFLYHQKYYGSLKATNECLAGDPFW